MRERNGVNERKTLIKLWSQFSKLNLHEARLARKMCIQFHTEKNIEIVKTNLTYKAILDQIEQIHEEKIELYKN